MANKYEDALEIARATEEYDFSNVFWACGVLAQEAEQLRKERDEFKDLYDVMVERYTELAKKVAGE